MYNADFNGAMLDGAGFTEPDLEARISSGASWRQASLLNAQADGVDFIKAMVDGRLPRASGPAERQFRRRIAAFTGANLEGADLNPI